MEQSIEWTSIPVGTLQTMLDTINNEYQAIEKEVAKLQNQHNIYVAMLNKLVGKREVLNQLMKGGDDGTNCTTDNTSTFGIRNSGNAFGDIDSGSSVDS